VLVCGDVVGVGGATVGGIAVAIAFGASVSCGVAVYFLGTLVYVLYTGVAVISGASMLVGTVVVQVFGSQWWVQTT